MCDLNDNCTCKPTLGDTMVNMVELANDFFNMTQKFTAQMRIYDHILKNGGPLPEPLTFDEVEGDGVLEQDSVEDYCTFCGRLCHCDLDYDVRQNELADD